MNQDEMNSYKGGKYYDEFTYDCTLLCDSGGIAAYFRSNATDNRTGARGSDYRYICPSGNWNHCRTDFK